jgi:integrase
MAAKKINHNMYQDVKSGIWYFQKDAKGRAYKFSLKTASVVEARRKRDEFLKQIGIHGYIQTIDQVELPESTLFGEVALKWAEVTEPDLAETTFDSFRKVMNTHILPNFGNKPIDKITALDIQTFISKLKCGKKTKKCILTPFRLVMKFAKIHHFITSNPFADVKPIKSSKRTKKRALTFEEINLFINALNEYWKPLFIFLFFSGARIAEASGLKWKHVDFQKRTVNIEKNLVRARGGKIVYKEPKTESSTREIKLPLFVIEALREQRKRSWKGEAENFVFINKAGNPIHRQTLNEYVINPALKKIGITKKISIKDTRATYITNSLDAKERLSFIQQQCGLTTPEMI